MKFCCKYLLVASLSLVFLSACSSTDVDEDPVSPLPQITASVSPKIDWSAQVGDGVGKYYSRLQPAVRYNKIFAADRNGLVEAFDEQTGKKVWTQDFSKEFRDNILAKNKGARLSGGITAARDKLFIGSESGILAVLNADDGKLVWSKKTDGELLSLPTIAEDMVAVTTGSGVLEAFNIEDGKHLWSYESLMPSLTLRGTGSASYEAGGFFVGTAEGKVAVIIKNNGQPAWEHAIYTPKGGNEFSRMADVDMTPLIVGNELYAVSFNGNLVSMELRSGRILWSRKYSSFDELAIAGLSLFVVDDHSRIYAVDKRNGLELWSNNLLSGRQLTSPTVYKDYLVVGDFDGYLHFIDLSDGKIVGRILIDNDGLYSRPVVADGKLYVQGRSGKVAAISLP